MRVYSAAMDTANVAYAADYQFEIDYEQALLTAELDYLIATGQDPARIAWMQTMKQPTIAYHVGILTADLAANHQYAITSAAENVDLWTHYMEYVLATAEAEKQLAIMDTATANACDLAEVLAENTWYLETDRFEYNRLIELWKIEKTRAVEVATLEDQYRRINQSVPSTHEQSIAAAATAAIEKADAAWAKSQIAVDDTYIDAMLKALEAESKAYDEAETAYYDRVEAIYKTLQTNYDTVHEVYDPQYETIEAGYTSAMKSLAGTYFDASFTVMATDSVSNLLPDSPWMASMRWLWTTTQTAWESLRETFLNKWQSLSDNYDRPKDALFALLAEDDELLDDLTDAALSDTNPFVAYQAAKLVADAEHILHTTTIKLAHEVTIAELDAEFLEQESQNQQTFNTAIVSAMTAYSQTNQAANENASSDMGVLNYVTKKEETTSRRDDLFPPISDDDVRKRIAKEDSKSEQIAEITAAETLPDDHVIQSIRRAEQPVHEYLYREHHNCTFQKTINH